ncbi:hypothetical protein E2C01_060469 [Portunus trituberculatus]|uniref:Uncharacterized protein n=1 Tax=Portunus trituberculatus TaxID=210409 RepID=A0A5B7H5C6_PORTR|nr:hypothetical protein [Portunus trituberculatus]
MWPPPPVHRPFPTATCTTASPRCSCCVREDSLDDGWAGLRWASVGCALRRVRRAASGTPGYRRGLRGPQVFSDRRRIPSGTGSRLLVYVLGTRRAVRCHAQIFPFHDPVAGYKNQCVEEASTSTLMSGAACHNLRLRDTSSLPMECRTSTCLRGLGPALGSGSLPQLRFQDCGARVWSKA